MSEQAVLNQSAAMVHKQVSADVHFEADPGPWLFFAAPLAFIVTLVTISWLSLSSF